MTIISEPSLIDKLESLRAHLSQVRDLETGNIIFLNLTSFYSFLDTSANTNGALQALLSDIQPFIPLTVSDEYFKLFIDAAIENDEDTLQSLESAFIQSSTAKFINAIYNASNDSAWNEIIGVCKKIRSYKETGLPGLSDAWK